MRTSRELASASRKEFVRDSPHSPCQVRRRSPSRLRVVESLERSSTLRTLSPSAVVVAPSHPSFPTVAHPATSSPVAPSTHRRGGACSAAAVYRTSSARRGSSILRDEGPGPAAAPSCSCCLVSSSRLAPVSKERPRPLPPRRTAVLEAVVVVASSVQVLPPISARTQSGPTPGLAPLAGRTRKYCTLSCPSGCPACNAGTATQAAPLRPRSAIRRPGGR